MNTYGNTQTNRWLNRGSYVKNWAERNEMLLGMFNEYGGQSDKVRVFAEFGCGANAPFSAACEKFDDYVVRKFDIHAWDEETTFIDLNVRPINIEKFDVCVFSGVLEYLNDVESVLAEVMRKCDFMLISYAFASMSPRGRQDQKYINLIKERSVKHGWRNHFGLDRFVEIISSIGIISDTCIWRNNQALFLVRNNSLDLIGRN